MLKSAASVLVLSLLAAPAVSAQTVPQSQDSYFQAARAELATRMAVQPNTHRARNVILFIGDGMGINTLTAARIYQGQQAGGDGESTVTTIDSLPYSALVRTYAHDAQVSDSAPTATALMSGIKTRNDVIGVNQNARVSDCASARGTETATLLDFARSSGRATGVVSTARLTHATPAATYAHTPNRDWENDSEIPAEAKAEGCIDIARQLVEGASIDVAMGGGRAQFLTTTTADPEDPERRGFRTDGQDLTQAWQARHPDGRYIWNRAGFDAIDPAQTGPVLGLFERDHMEFEVQRAADAGGEPSLSEMTAKAIRLLQARPEGYVLVIEAGRIDHAHHIGLAGIALDETVELNRAVRTALDAVDLSDTLVVVTADHSHNLSIVGYPRRGNPILGTVVDVDGVPMLGTDGKPYTTLSYANGPGAEDGARVDPSTVDTRRLDYEQPALVPLRSASHGGEDVAVKAIGPWAHLFGGTIEQNLIYHIMVQALEPAQP
ncbi:alkaline phosphatase [Brevundimonas variabilis]|uniref:Alkaline phosphatase n=1 Tax=Brevundimonas variabilis TaxID=74312 RepID=A0A7W9CKL2_9CAUL|nr:alkaline phosphatase [Brevundimonas variabilis]MBB5747153.1 alkaline phosphatase [Brevundimonas variabilis]